MNINFLKKIIDTLATTNADTILDFLRGIEKKVWIQIGVGLGVALIVWQFFIYPAWVERAILKGKVDDIKFRKNKVIQLTADKPKLMKYKEESTILIKETKAKLFGRAQAQRFVSLLAKTAKARGLGILSTKTPKVREYGEEYGSYGLDLTLTGGYHEFANFISDLEHHSKILVVEQINLRPQTGAPKKHIFDLTVTAYSSGLTKEEKQKLKEEAEKGLGEDNVG